MFRYLIVLFGLLSALHTAKAGPSDEYLFVSGLGDTESRAMMDAKQQLVLNIYSEVQVSNATHISKTNQQVFSHFEQNTAISSLPVKVPNLDIVSSECDQASCKYQFKINKKHWADMLIRELTSSYEVASLKLHGLGSNWADFMIFSEISDVIKSNDTELKVLSVLEPNAAQALFLMAHQINQQLVQAARHISVSFRSSSDPFTREVRSILASHTIASSQGNLTIYIQSSSRAGKSDEGFVVQQSVQLKAFEQTSPSVVVAQKVITQLGVSPYSRAKAMANARQQLIEKIKNEPIHSLFNGNK